MINEIFSNFNHHPCWLVKQGYGSFLTFEFGQPSLRIRKPRSVYKNQSKVLREVYSRRKVTVKGEWHLWIYCCTWEVYFNNKRLAHSESTNKRIGNALSYLDGQKIFKIDIDPTNGNTTFHFDLGGKLVTKGYDDNVSELWNLYVPDGHVLSIRNDGKFSFKPGDTHPDEIEWVPIKG